MAFYSATASNCSVLFFLTTSQSFTMTSSFSLDQYLYLNSANILSSSSPPSGISKSMGKASVIGGVPSLALELKLVNPSTSVYFTYAARISSRDAPSAVHDSLKLVYVPQIPLLCL